MATIDEFWPTFIDSFKEDIAARAKRIDELPSDQLIWLALELIMEEQQRTGHRSEGWPSAEHNAVRFVLHNKTEE